MATHILAIDQGTTGTTCLILALDAHRPRIVGRGYAEFTQHFPQPGWVEHDLEEIWQSTREAITAALRAAALDGRAISAIGITNQRETTGVWDEHGVPQHRAIVWQDRRTADHCRALEQAGHARTVREKTGLVIDPYFSATKLAWLLDHQPALRSRAKAGELRFGTIDSWLVWRLTGSRAHVTDASNASRTLLYDIHRGHWDAELCALFGELPLRMLPEVRPSSDRYGETRGVEILPDGIPITGMAGDQQAALFGQACLTPGMAKCTYGTGAFALVNTGETAVRTERLVTTIAWRLGDTTTYALEGSAFIAGAAVQWLRDGLKMFEHSADIETLAHSVEDSGGVIVVPAFTGLGAPYWRPDARGLICGLTRGTTRAHIARAALEGIALQVHDLLDTMHRDWGQPLRELRVDGGAAANELLMQFQADLLGLSIRRPTILDTTALGAGLLAALGAGFFHGTDDVASAWQLERSFEPRVETESMQSHIERWHAAVAKA